MKKTFPILLAALLTLTGCSEKEAMHKYVSQYSFTASSKAQSFPVANAYKGGILLHTYGRDLVHRLSLWKGDAVTELAAEDVANLYGLTVVDGRLYYWEPGGICQYDPDTETSTRLFTFGRDSSVERFWASGHTLYAVTSVYDPGYGKGFRYGFYRYDLKKRQGESLDWLDGFRILATEGVIGDELLLASNELDSTRAWLNVTDGSTRPCTASRPAVGYRDGDLILYNLGSDTLTFHDVQTCAETTVPVPELVAKTLDETDACQLIAAGDAIYWLFKEEYLLTLEEAVYQPFDPLLEYGSICTLYRQTDESFEPVFEYTGYPNECNPYYQLMGDTLYFAFYGYPSDEYPVVDLIDHDPEQQQPVMTFAVLKPDGTTYLLAEEYYPFPNS